MIGRGLLALALLSNCGKEIIIIFILIMLIRSLYLFGSDARVEAAFRRCFRRSSAPRTAAHPHLGSRPKMQRVHLHLRQIQSPVTVFVTSRCYDSCFVIFLSLPPSVSLPLSLSPSVSLSVSPLQFCHCQWLQVSWRMRTQRWGFSCQAETIFFFLQWRFVKMN